ncbi:26S proteasome non-ATPase regulatory subunit 10 [Vigna unguiculata]|uniref:26S proteasome non-ATPase regulatory subunit 10 n=1 Tax=Vigna unguiculata TaxID=3917 RepID=A0A4D6LZ81_VIGUN|nr:26S proteasome non-ATPase regulatory subunit 10 [Vigna unguiculata]
MEVKATQTVEDHTIATLYEASLKGCVSTLHTLIQRNPLILNRVSLSPFTETPLHIASLLGHLEFCEALVKRKPSLVSEADSEGRFPLHLASAEGHTEVVKSLLLTNPDLCYAVDKDDMLPLHFAAMRGRVGTIQELIKTRPDSIHRITHNGSVLHFCVRFNHLEALRFFVQSATMNQDFLLAKDKEGNTLLHLAVKLKQIKTIKYLLTLPEMRTAARALNEAGLTNFEVLEESDPRDFITLKIQNMLTEAGVQIINAKQQGSSSSSSASSASPSIIPTQPAQESKRMKLWETLWLKYLQYRPNWIEEKRGSLMVVATVIASMTFQSAINPPGGVWQEDTHSGGLSCSSYGTCKAGTAVLAYDLAHDGFLRFATFNSVSFFSSLYVVMILLSGLRVDNKPMMWILTIVLFLALSSIGNTYISAQRLVTPHHLAHKVGTVNASFSTVWKIIIAIVVLFHFLHLLILCVKKF